MLIIDNTRTAIPFIPVEEDRLVVCNHCKRKFDEDDIQYDSCDNEFILCPECAGNHKCCDCGDSSVTVVDCMGRCVDCFACIECGISFPLGDQPENIEGNLYCESCADVYHEGEDEDYGVIKDSGYKPTPIFHGASEDELFFGTELEVEVNGGNRRSVLAEKITEDLAGFGYVKSDGSIDCGWELVTHPFSWSWLQEHEDVLDPFFDLHGITAEDTCGMHVHMSAKAFTNRHLYKLMKFFWTAQEMIWDLSGREGEVDSNSYARFNDAPSSCDSVSQGYGRKWSAVSLSSSTTVEVRIFAGTTKKEVFLRNIEFCLATYHFTKQASVDDVRGATSAELFKTFIEEEKEKYPLTNAWVENRS